jgi:hypothetical protein
VCYSCIEESEIVMSSGTRNRSIRVVDVMISFGLTIARLPIWVNGHTKPH